MNFSNIEIVFKILFRSALSVVEPSLVSPPTVVYIRWL